MNRRLIQNKLDRAAVILDKKGYKDLADRVDHYGDRFIKASSKKEVELIKRALARVNDEADRRDGKEGKTDDRPSIRERIEARRKQRRGAGKGLEDRIAKLERRVARLILRSRKGTDNKRSAREARNARLARLRKNRLDPDI
jgi:hypothetical protein